MFKLLAGSIVASIAMFITGFVFFGLLQQPLAGGPTLTSQQQANIQTVLGQNLPSTATYAVPNAGTPEGTVMFGKGPIATIHYNSSGFNSGINGAELLKGYVHELIVCLLLALALARLDRRIPDFASRARIVVFFSLAACALISLGNPIWYKHDWTNAIFEFIGNAAMLIIAGLILARWFLPVSAEIPAQVDESTSAKEIPPMGGAGI
jgi:hypothetical protein